MLSLRFEAQSKKTRGMAQLSKEIDLIHLIRKKIHCTTFFCRLLSAVMKDTEN